MESVSWPRHLAPLSADQGKGASLLLIPHTTPEARSLAKQSASFSTSSSARASLSTRASSYRRTRARPDTTSGGAGAEPASTGGGGGGGGGCWISVARPWSSVVTMACELIRFLVKAIRFSYMVMSLRTFSSSSRSAWPTVSSS